MKFKNQADIKVGTLVVFNELPDATVFTVIERNGFAIRITQAGTNYKPQESDVDLCHKPTKEQLAAFEQSKRYEVQDTDGNWHPINGVQYAAYRLDGVPVREV